MPAEGSAPRPAEAAAALCPQLRFSSNSRKRLIFFRSLLGPSSSPSADRGPGAGQRAIGQASAVSPLQKGFVLKQVSEVTRHLCY